ncbi:MAG: hypothetical protein JWQ83_887, partial [Lacunisphaera sp.]|nr:hypothetical protein [Lacunisphaera sp.]
NIEAPRSTTPFTAGEFKQYFR